MADNTQSNRQLRLLSLLADKPDGMAQTEIQHALLHMGIDVSSKTVKRDIDDLSLSFYLIEEQRKGRTYYSVNVFNLDRLVLTWKDILSLRFMKSLLNPYQHIEIGDSALSLLNKLIDATPSINHKWLDSIADLLLVNISDLVDEKNVQPRHLELIQEAIAERKRLLIRYHSFGNDELTERKVDPYFVEISEGCYHLIGYCHLRSGNRDFRLSRIEWITKTDELFTRPDNVYEDYCSNRFLNMSGSDKVTVRLRFTGMSARLIEEYYRSKSDSLIHEPEGAVLFERETSLTPEFERFILSFGDEVEVLEPESLRKSLADKVRRIMRKYKDFL